MDIAIFIAQNNPMRAQTFVDELEEKCEALAIAPGIGTARPELGEGIFMLPYRRYLIFYRVVSKALRIERVVHGGRDIGGDDFEADNPSITAA